MRRINLGCGRNPMDGWHNVDRARLPGVDENVDLEWFIPWANDTIDEYVGIDLIEHIKNPLKLMERLWECAKPGARCRFELPYGSSDDAWEDPTHVRPYFLNSWIYFAQPTYYRADYGYRGDWQAVEIELHVRPGVEAEDVMFTRNTVLRQVVTLEAIKPARPCDQSLMQQAPIKLVEVQ